VEEEAHWTRLWKLKAPQRLKMFAWLILQDRLMTNWNISRRGLTDNPLCTVCDSAYEDIDHVLRMCPKAKDIWRFFARLNLGKRGYDADFRSWFLANLTDMQQDETRLTKYLVILWYIWKWRNGACLGRTNYIPLHKFHYLMEKCDKVLQALHKNARECNYNVVARSEILIRWQSPPTGWMSLNTDGASKGNPGKAGVGVCSVEIEGNGFVVLGNQWAFAQP